MDASGRTVTLAGIAMVMLAVLTIIVVGLTASTSGDKSPFDKQDVPQFLTDAADNADTITVASAVGIINDGLFTIAVGASLYVLFRDRNPLLATLAAIGIAVTAAISLVVDFTNILTVQIAKDYVSGGAGGIPAKDASTLELGRYVGMVSMGFFNLIFTPLGVALIAIGSLLVSAPQGLINPPKWLGWVAIVSGAAGELAWLVFVSDAFFLFAALNLITSLVFLFGLGIWLLRHGDLQPAPMRA